MAGHKKSPPNGKGVDGDAVKSKPDVWVRILFSVAVVGNIVTMYRSVILLTTYENSVLPQGEFLSFLPPGQFEETKNDEYSKIQENARKHAVKNSKTNTKKIKELKRKAEEFHKKNSPPRRKPPILPLDFELINFFSHIPKTGAEYAALELSKLAVATIPLPRNKTIHSIMIAQGRYNMSLTRHRDYNESDPEWTYFHKNSRGHDHESPDSKAYAPEMICNQANAPVKWLSPFHFGLQSPTVFNTKFRCSMIVSEWPWNERAKNIYTIVREPMSHLISQYFHCCDSDNSKHRHLMPSLQEWIDAYTDLSNTLPLETRPPYIELWKQIPEAKALRDKYQCYNPIDSESDFVKFPPVQKDGTRMVLPNDYTFPYHPNHITQGKLLMGRDKATQRIDEQLFNDLKKRFRIIGDMNRMIKTVCAIFIDLHGGKHIPKPCDCTNVDKTKSEEALSATFNIPNLWSPDRNEHLNSKKYYYRPYIEIGYNSSKHSHGVKVSRNEPFGICTILG